MSGGRQATAWLPRTVLVATGLFLVISLGAMLTARVYADDDEARPAGSRLMTLYENGVERSFLTTAATVGEALKEANVEVDSRDRVEPGLDEELVADSYTVNVYRARPLLVVDGAVRVVITTASQIPSQIARDAGITLYDEDITTRERSQNILADGAAERFVIKRASAFTLVLYGETLTARTQATTVGEMLREKQITLGNNDRASLPLDTPITEGMKVKVWREGKQTVTRDEAVNFEVETIRDANRPLSYRAVKTPGVKGKRTVTYEVIIKNGKESSRKEIASITRKKPVKQVEVVGTKLETVPYTGGGSKTEWLKAAGVPQQYWGYADALISRESGWNPNAVNSSSGACGLAQALPCSKVPGNPLNPVDSLKWMNGYVNGRYGGWQGAYNFWQRNHWY